MIPFLFIVLTVPGFVLAVRALPWVDAKVMAGVKPWACDICSCFWATILWGAIAGGVWGLDGLLATPPAYVGTLVLLGYLSRPMTPPPELS